MNRARFRKKFLRDESLTNRKNQKIRSSLCNKLLSKSKKPYFSSLNTNGITDSRWFWWKVIPLFTKKELKLEKIIITAGGKNISDYKKLSAKFYNLLSNDVSDMKIPHSYYCFSDRNTTIIEAFEELWFSFFI